MMFSLLPKYGKFPALFNDICPNHFKIQLCGLKHLLPPPSFDDNELPAQPKLRLVPKVPTYPPNLKPPKMMKQLHLIRGPEKIHNTLIHKQYGVAVVVGGRMKHCHFEVIRLALQKKLDFKRMFAIWRVDAPWQACTKRPAGITAGGGKGHIHHYVTPVKAHRILFEVGGKCEFEEVKYFLQVIANKMPFKARAVSHEMLEAEKHEEKRIKEQNMNPFDMEYMIKNNMLGCGRWTKRIDYEYFGKYL